MTIHEYNDTVLTNDALNQLNCLVCGASRGIGRATAIALAKAGASVIAIARNAEKLEILLNELNTISYGKHSTYCVDLENPESIDAALDQMLEKNGQVHVLINNSGGPPSGSLLDVESNDFMKYFQRHLLASHQLVKRLSPGMEEDGYGRIINVISTSVREPIANIGLSNTVRGAMASWSKSLSMELPSCITINNILPGFTDTDRLDELSNSLAIKNGVTPEDIRKNWVSQVPAGRLARPEETAAAISFLASPAAGYIRGISLAVDGGRMKSI